jgi:hypothetical protein
MLLMSNYPKIETPEIKIPRMEDLMDAKMQEHIRQLRERSEPAIKGAEMMVEAVQKMQNLMTGAATFRALQVAVNETLKAAPKDHDVVILAFGITVTNVSFAKPHTLYLGGYNADGHRTIVVAHHSQMVAHVIYRPQQGPDRIITGFGEV